MSKRAFDKIKSGLLHAIADAKGEKGNVTKVTKMKSVTSKSKKKSPQPAK